MKLRTGFTVLSSLVAIMAMGGVVASPAVAHSASTRCSHDPYQPSFPGIGNVQFSAPHERCSLIEIAADVCTKDWYQDGSPREFFAPNECALVNQPYYVARLRLTAVTHGPRTGDHYDVITLRGIATPENGGRREPISIEFITGS